MAKENIKVYTYTRVSTAMQIDGYSLDAQKSRMKAFAEFNDYEDVYKRQISSLVSPQRNALIPPWQLQP